MILDSVSHLLPGLLPASFRGVSFFVPDTATEVGRRVAEHLFPGIDRAAYDDFGLYPADVSIDGLMVGDDYIAQAKRLRAAFERPGPGTLLHPWLGGMTVILTEPAEISFSATELRVARFSASFKRIGAGGAAGIVATAASLLGAASSLQSASAGLAVAAGTTTISSVRALATAASWLVVTATWAQAAQAASPVLSDALTMAPPTDPVAFSSQVAAISAALCAGISALGERPAVSSAAEYVPAVDLAPRAGLDVCMAVARILLDAESPSATDQAMVTAAAGDAIATANRIAVYCTYASRNEAVESRNALSTMIGRFTESCAELTGVEFAADVSIANLAAVALRAAMIADINEVIGRLPAVLVLVTETPTNAFQVANHLYGDEPGAIESGYVSIVSRNRPRHPAQLPAGRVEALR